MYVGQRKSHQHFFFWFLQTGTFSRLNYNLQAGNFQLVTEAEISRVIKKSIQRIKQQTVSLIKPHLLNMGVIYLQFTEYSVTLRSVFAGMTL